MPIGGDQESVDGRRPDGEGEQVTWLCTKGWPLDVARVARMTKQGVSKLLPLIEDERETPKRDALLDAATRAVLGG